MQEQKNNLEKINFDKSNFDDLIKYLEKFAKENYIPILKKDSLEYILELISNICYTNNDDSINILEIGTAIGYTSIQINNLLKTSKYRSNYSDFSIITIEKNKENFDIAKCAFSKVENRVEAINDDALLVLEKWEKNSEYIEHFDLIFIDANKSGYLKYFEYAKKILKKDGLIVIDNIFLNGLLELEYLDVRRKKRALHKNMTIFLEKLGLSELLLKKCNKKDLNKNVIIDGEKFQIVLKNIGDGVLTIKKI